MSKLLSRAGAGLVMAAAVALAGCGQNAPQAQGGPPPAPAVTVAKPVQQTVVEHDEYVGRFVPVDSVEMRARVSGYLDRIHFTDGQLVQQGDLLFTIDRRPFENALEQAKANLAQSRANLAFAEADLERGSQLVRDKTITQQTFDQRTQAKRVAEASVAAQEAATRQATLDLQFTELRAPVSGRIGDRRVSIGNLVTGGTGGTTTLLATINSIDPIRFEFTFDEASYLRYERAAQGGKDVTSREGLQTLLRLAAGKFRQKLRDSSPDPSVLCEQIEASVEAARYLDRNVNIALTIENLVMQWSKARE